jgi:hypothetical protein
MEMKGDPTMVLCLTREAGTSYLAKERFIMREVSGSDFIGVKA